MNRLRGFIYIQSVIKHSDQSSSNIFSCLLWRNRTSLSKTRVLSANFHRQNGPRQHGLFQDGRPTNNNNKRNHCMPSVVTKNSLRRNYSATISDHAKSFNFIADAVEIASPAVVYVDVKIQQQGGGFFGGGVAQGAGSGFVVTDYGVILTNAHVVMNATSVDVKMASGDVIETFKFVLTTCFNLLLIANMLCHSELSHCLLFFFLPSQTSAMWSNFVNSFFPQHTIYQLSITQKVPFIYRTLGTIQSFRKIVKKYIIVFKALVPRVDPKRRN